LWTASCLVQHNLGVEDALLVVDLQAVGLTMSQPPTLVPATRATPTVAAMDVEEVPVAVVVEAMDRVVEDVVLDLVDHQVLDQDPQQ